MRDDNTNYNSGFLKEFWNDNQGPSIKQDRPLWQQVKDLQDQMPKNPSELGEARATMIVNFGPEGTHTKGLVEERMSLIAMIVKVLEHFIPKTN